MNFKNLLFCVISLSLLLWSCTAGNSYVKLKQELEKQYPVNRYYFDVGEAPLNQPTASSPGAAEAMAREVALNLARAGISRQIRIAIQAQVLDLLMVKHVDGTVEETLEITQIITSRTNEILKGVKVVQEDREDRLGIYRVVAVMPKGRANLNLNRLETDLAALTQMVSVPKPGPPKTSPPPLTSIERDTARGGVWVEGEGEAPFGLDTTLGKAKTQARDAARKDAIERAVGTHLKSKTVVHNSQLVEDLITTAARGIIEEEHVLEEKMHELKGTVFYVKIRARIRLDQVEHQDFVLTAFLNRDSFKEGDEARIHISLNEDGYIYIFNISQDEQVWQLLPNVLVSKHFIRSGEEFVFPDEPLRNRGVKLRVSLLPDMTRATEHIKVIASRKKLNLKVSHVKEAIFPLHAGKESGMIADLIKALAHIDGTEWAEITLPYDVKK